MPYKRERSPFYYVRRRALPGYGDTGRLSAKTTSKKTAGEMERLLDQLADRALGDAGWYPLLDAVCKERKITLPELLRAKATGRLEALRRSLSDPLLTAALEGYERSQKPARVVKTGMDMLLAYAPEGARLGDLTAKAITELCVRAEEDGRKRNSVRRMMLRAISLVLRFHFGKSERDRIFSDVQYAGEDDTREVHLSPAEIGGLLSASAQAHPELPVIVRMAMQTSADRGVLLAGKSAVRECRGLRVRDLRVFQNTREGTYYGEVYLYDTKTEKRSRTVPLTDLLCRDLLALCRDKAPDDPVFSLSYQQLDFPWKRAREAAKLEHVRFKDLRAQFSIYGEEADVPLTVLSKSMGHGDENMTRRYQQRRATLSGSQAEAIERAMLSSAGGGGEGLRKTA